MVTREEVVIKAREYMDTPFHHQGRVKGEGVDCAGLVICVANELGLSEFNTVNYERLPNGQAMKQTLDEQMQSIPFAEVQPGDVLLFAFDKDPQHVAIVTMQDYIIHAYAQIRKVREHRLDDVWRSRVRGAYRFHGIA